MVGSIAVGLGIHNIIFHFQYRDVALLGNQVGNPVNIVCKRADNADSGDIIYIFHDVLDRKLPAVMAHFFRDALRRFNARSNMFNRIILMCLFKFIIQYLKFCPNFKQGGVVQ